MNRSLFLCALVVIAASCRCGGTAEPCDLTNCAPGLECAPATGKCVVVGGTGGGATTGGGGAVGGGGGSTGGGGAVGGGGTDAGVCPTTCTGATPVCDVAAQRCVVCVSSSDCPVAEPFCVTTVQPAGACYECRNLLDCPNANDCDPVTHRCLAPPDAGTRDGGSNEPVVYGHTASTLYKVNATTKLVTPVASFNNCNGDVIDLALDEFSRAFVTTNSGLYQLDLVTARCTEVNFSTTETYPNSLSFVPRGSIDPNFEVLVGYAGSSYVRINLTTGTMQQIGTLGGGFVSSGDIVSVIDGGSYLTAKNPGGMSSLDYLLEVNPTTGGLVRSFGTLPFNDVYGLAFWGGSLYGFSNGGTLFEITITGSTTMSVPVPNAASQTWNGAGSTTAARLR